MKAILDSITHDESTKLQLITGVAVDKAEQLSECSPAYPWGLASRPVSVRWTDLAGKGSQPTQTTVFNGDSLPGVDSGVGRGFWAYITWLICPLNQDINPKRFKSTRHVNDRATDGV